MVGFFTKFNTRRKKMKKVLAAALCLLFAFCVSPLYAGEAGNNYMAFKPGFYSPQHSDIDDFDEGFSGEISFGYKYNPNFAAEMGIGYFHTENSYRGGIELEELNLLYKGSFDIDVYPVTFTLRGIIPYNDFEFYGLTGIGLYVVKGDADIRVNVDDLILKGSLDDTTTVFGFHLGLGLHYNFTPTWFIGAEGKYFWTGTAKLKDKIEGAPVEAKFKLDGILATAVVGFRF
jgi:opacity protein-like surface antigen